jgi:hypothetical protein
VRKPTIDRRGEALLFLWEEQGVGIALDLLHERSDGIHGEITVQRENGPGSAGHIHWARINLSSTTARDGLEKALVKKTKDDRGECSYEWNLMIEYACSVAAKRHREGDPFVSLRDMPVPPKLTYLLDKMIPVGQTSLLYSSGGSGKSLIAMAIAVAVSSGYPLPGGLRPLQKTKVLYLDYETDEEEQRLRLEWIRAGMLLPEVPDIICRHQTRPFVDDLARIRREVDTQGIGLVIVDSIAYALGGSAMDADYVIAAFNGLRSLGNQVSRLVIAHIPKAEKGAQQASIYGSVFFENAGRSVWEVRSETENDGITMGLFQRKANWGKKFAPFGLRFVFDDVAESLTIQHHAIEDDPELASHGSVSFQILAALRSGKRTPKQLQADIGGNLDTVRKTLLRLEKRQDVLSFPPLSGGPGSEKSYALALRNGTNGRF